MANTKKSDRVFEAWLQETQQLLSDGVCCIAHASKRAYEAREGPLNKTRCIQEVKKLEAATPTRTVCELGYTILAWD